MRIGELSNIHQIGSLDVVQFDPNTIDTLDLEAEVLDLTEKIKTIRKEKLDKELKNMVNRDNLRIKMINRLIEVLKLGLPEIIINRNRNKLRPSIEADFATEIKYRYTPENFGVRVVGKKNYFPLSLFKGKGNIRYYSALNPDYYLKYLPNHALISLGRIKGMFYLNEIWYRQKSFYRASRTENLVAIENDPYLVGIIYDPIKGEERYFLIDRWNEKDLTP